MPTLFESLDQLEALAKRDPELRQKLLDTRHAKDPLDAFCTLAAEQGCPVSLGEPVASGQEYSDNQCKSTNGGNPSPYKYFDDTYENFLNSL